MAFNIELYLNSSENNRLEKSISQLTTFSGDLRSECSIIDPIITFEGDLSMFAGANYLRIPSFNRYYFIRNIRSIRTNLVEVTAHVDVLMSFANAIKSNRAIIRRNTNKWNLYLNDGSLKCYQNPLILTKAFPAGFTTQEFILAVASGTGFNDSSSETLETV